MFYFVNYNQRLVMKSKVSINVTVECTASTVSHNKIIVSLTMTFLDNNQSLGVWEPKLTPHWRTQHVPRDLKGLWISFSFIIISKYRRSKYNNMPRDKASSYFQWER